MKQKRTIYIITLLLTALPACSRHTDEALLTRYVDPRIGSSGHGHVFVGASVPFGMVQLGPTSITQEWDWCSGYHESESSVIGFSHTHLSGTGIGDMFDVTVMPVTGEVTYARGTLEEPESGLWSMADRTREVAIRLKDEKLVFDSRMAWFFAPDTFKVYVTVDPATAARRVGIDPRPGEPASEVEIYKELEERSKVEQARFIKFYGEGADYYNWNNFNLIVDSTNRTAAEVAEVIWQAFEAYCADPEANAHVEIL